jgi:hypothetical protein
VRIASRRHHWLNAEPSHRFDVGVSPLECILGERALSMPIRVRGRRWQAKRAVTSRQWFIVFTCLGGPGPLQREVRRAPHAEQE